MSPYWEHFSHQADVGVRGIGKTKEEAFSQAALAMMAVVSDPGSIKALTPVSLTCSAPDDALLLVDWLNAVIYEMAVRHMLFSRFEVQIAGTDLTATAWGERVDLARHQPAVEPKGATYTELEVVCRQDGSWLAQCVIDV